MSADDTTGFHTVQPKKPLCDFSFFFLRKKSDEVARKGLAFQLFLQIKLPSGSEAPPPTPASPEQGKQSRATLCQHLRRVHSMTPHAQGQGCGQDCVFTVQLGKTPCQGCARTELCPPGRLPRQTPCEHPQHPPNTRPAGKERHSVGAQEHPHPLREQSSAQASNRPLLSPGTSHPGETLHSCQSRPSPGRAVLSHGTRTR